MTNHRHDRDAIVDRMLAGMARGPEQPAGPCLDTETLAAWADDALDARELAAAESHAADCGRCQAMLAAMSRTVPTMPAATVSSWRMPPLRWLAPLMAAAAAAAIWMVVAPRQGPVAVRQVSQIAEPAQPPAAAPPSDAIAAPAEAAASRTAARRAQEGPRQPEGVEADQKAGATSNADVAPQAPAGAAEVRVGKAQAAEAPAAAAASPPAPLAETFAFRGPGADVLSPNPGSRWRLLRGGDVQRSADGGATWQTQNTGVTETLSAGASPLPSVCWLVGPGGIVLLSTDGRSWSRLPFPEVVPLVAVRATDAQTATVTTADGREWVTEDAGRTWARAQGR